MYEIEKGVPFPPTTRNTHLVDTMVALKAHESFLVTDKQVQTVQQSMRKAYFITGHVFSSRTVEGGTRVWRTG